MIVNEKIHIPEKGAAAEEEDIWEWYQNIPRELSDTCLSENRRLGLSAYYEEAGLLRRARRTFFRRHYSQTIAVATQYLFGRSVVPRILDLGCGMGTQSLLFASYGARVVGFDMDDEALQILDARHRDYEQAAGRSLAIESYCGNALSFDFATAGAPFDGVFSMFAFNMMQPSTALLDVLTDCCRPGARVAILDGNCLSLLSRIWPPRRRDVLNPVQLRSEFERRGWVVHQHRGAVSIPPVCWSLAPYRALEYIDKKCNQTWLFPVSHLFLAERNSE